MFSFIGRKKEEVNYPQNYGAVKHALRDESPPASPQFVPRTPMVQQYAPVAPVFFNRRTSLTHLTPSSMHVSRTVSSENRNN